MNILAGSTSYTGNVFVATTCSAVGAGYDLLTSWQGTTPLFSVRGDGKMTVPRGGFYVSSSGATVNSHGMTVVTGGMSVVSGGLVVTTGGATLNNGLTVLV